MLTNKLKKPACEFFKFSDFAPLVFEKLRFNFGITNEDYQRSTGPENFIGKMVIGHLAALSEKCSTGKSGSFFYQTHDNKYLLKTIPKK
jgi:1-phosphatidylinositol-4-phosphate 5-kinase